MPFIDVKTTTKITQEQEIALKTELGEAISIIPGKSEMWLMLNFADDCNMYFKGSNEKDLAFIEVLLFGSASDNDYDKLTAKITDIFVNHLGLSSDCIYIKYTETDRWGWNGSNL